MTSGDVESRLFLIGTPEIDPTTGQFSIPDLDYDVRTRSVLILAVGIMLSTFGTFWAGEALEVGWPGGDAALLALVAFYVAVGLSLIAGLRRRALT